MKAKSEVSQIKTILKTVRKLKEDLSELRSLASTNPLNADVSVLKGELQNFINTLVNEAKEVKFL